VLRELGKITNLATDVAAGQLGKGAFFFAMHFCEYLKVLGERRTKLLELQNLRFFKDHQEVPHHDLNLHLDDSITIKFEW